MKYAPTVAKHRTIDPERTKRHMLKSTPDTITLRIPRTGAEQDEHITRFHEWVRKWSLLHKVTDPYITTGTDDYYRTYYIAKSR